MPSWKLRGLSLFGFWIVSFSFLFSPAFLPGEEVKEFPVATLSLQVTLVGITAYGDFQEIRAALSQSEGVEKLSIETEAPGLVTFSLRYSGEPKSLMEKLHAFFPEKYSFHEKHLPSGTREITVSRKAS